MAKSKDETRLLERLLSDPEFRARFRSDPRAAAEEAGIDLPAGLDADGDPMKTLDGRESKSSFAGALMAAAVEGIGLYELGQHVLPGVEDAHAATTPSAHWDPAEFGAAGTGGPPSHEALGLLDNHNVGFDPDGIADLKAGKIDPRVVSVLDVLSEKHRITISSMVSDHSKLTAGGSISNHYYGRAFDIATVNGRPVTPGNLAARQLAVALSRLPASIRPSEIGSPWRLPGAAYFTDGDHQNHVHVGFDDPIKPSWTPPSGPGHLPAAPAPAPVEAVAQPVEPDANAQEAQDAAAAAAIVQQAEQPQGSPAGSLDPDDLQGNLDDEDAGDDEEDGSNEDEPDEGGGEDDGEGGDGDDGQDAPGEGSSGEDATDDNASGSDGGGSDPASGGSDPPDGAGAPNLEGVDSAYPGDHAPRGQIAAWMASEAKKRGLPPELPVMAALTESGLRNLNYGDADSIGFFQMRTSIWNHGTYSGYGEHPERQLKWFLDQAESVKKQRLARGASLHDPHQFGEWIADIERPATQYRGRYQLRLEEAQALLGTR